MIDMGKTSHPNDLLPSNFGNMSPKGKKIPASVRTIRCQRRETKMVRTEAGIVLIFPRSGTTSGNSGAGSVDFWLPGRFGPLKGLQALQSDPGGFLAAENGLDFLPDTPF